MGEMTLPIGPERFWFLVALVAVAVLSFVIWRQFDKQERSGIKFKAAFGADAVPDALFVLLVSAWTVLTLFLFGGVLATIWMILQQVVQDTGSRAPLIQLAALTATLSAAIALPFTAIRLRLTLQQTDTAKAALFNQKITEAAADLHAQRQVSQKVAARKWETLWEDDVVRRNAAIDRLEGLVREEPQEAARVSRLLSVYVRELSDEIPAQPTPDTEDVGAIKAWAHALEIPRSDMQNAVQVLGRLANIEGVDPDTLEIDLRKANLQAMALSSLTFEKAKFEGVALQGANLSGAELQGAFLFHTLLQGSNLSITQLQEAIFYEAQLQGADLAWANLQETKLYRAQLQGAVLAMVKLQKANLFEVQLQGADLSQAAFNSSTQLISASFAGASIGLVDLSKLPQITDHLDDLFGDGSTKLPPGVPWPVHWPKEKLDDKTFRNQWHAWAATKGIDIP